MLYLTYITNYITSVSCPNFSPSAKCANVHQLCANSPTNPPNMLVLPCQLHSHLCYTVTSATSLCTVSTLPRVTLHSNTLPRVTLQLGFYCWAKTSERDILVIRTPFDEPKSVPESARQALRNGRVFKSF
jgi:hypothetical protein